MKKIVAVILTLITILSMPLISVSAEEINIKENEVKLKESIDPRASLYFSAYAYDLEPSDTKGYLWFSSLVSRTNRADKIRVYVQIQQYNDGWEDYGGEYIGTSSKASYSFEDEVKVERGKEYRALFYYEAFVNNKVVETREGSTNSVLAP